jgi:hypothetical protein
MPASRRTSVDAQIRQLRAAGAGKVFRKVASGAWRALPKMLLGLVLCAAAMAALAGIIMRLFGIA